MNVEHTVADDGAVHFLRFLPGDFNGGRCHLQHTQIQWFTWHCREEREEVEDTIN